MIRAFFYKTLILIVFLHRFSWFFVCFLQKSDAHTRKNSRWTTLTLLCRKLGGEYLDLYENPTNWSVCGKFVGNLVYEISCCSPNPILLEFFPWHPAEISCFCWWKCVFVGVQNLFCFTIPTKFFFRAEVFFHCVIFDSFHSFLHCLWDVVMCVCGDFTTNRIFQDTGVSIFKKF